MITSNNIRSNVSNYNITIDTQLPDWVYAYQSSDKNSLTAENGVKYLLLEEQYYIQKNKVTKYTYSVKQLINMQGVELFSKIFLEFNAEHSQLIIHEINIDRDGVILNKLPTADMDVLQRENLAESNIFSGDLTLSIILDDVKPGDILKIKYSYVDNCENNITNFNRIIFLQLNVLLYERLVFILSDQDVNLRYKLDSDLIIIQENVINERNLLSLIIKNPDRAVYVKYEPNWYKPKNLFQVCIDLTWQEISYNIMKLYEPVEITHGALLEIINTYKSGDAESCVLAILKYIHNNIRYLANYKATGAILPANPNSVARRGYGDCKDFSYMMHCILSILGVESSIVLINTTFGKGLHDFLPSPALFNHIIVRIKVDGNYYYIDPTVRQYVNKLKYLYLPNYGLGLVCNGESHALSPILNDISELTSVITEDYYEVKSWKNNDISFSTKITFTGRLALLVGSYIDNNPEVEFWKYVQERYSRYFLIKEILKFGIDRSSISEGKLGISISYAISAKFLTVHNRIYSLEALMMVLFDVSNNAVPAPQNVESDFYFNEPLRLKYTIGFSDGASRSSPNEEIIISNDAFMFNKKHVTHKKNVSYHYEYIIKQEVVKKKEYEVFYQDYSKLNEIEPAKFSSVLGWYRRNIPYFLQYFFILVFLSYIGYRESINNNSQVISNAEPIVEVLPEKHNQKNDVFNQELGLLSSVNNDQ